MGRSALQYKNLLKSLLPPGRALTRALGSFLDQLMYALAEELARIEARADDLVKESRVSTAEELLGEYEEEFDLPDPGLELKTTVAGRRADILAKQITIGQQNRSYYEDIADKLGFNINIETFNCLRVGIARAGDRIGNELDVFIWLARVDADGVKGAFDWCFESNGIDCLAGNSWNWAMTTVTSWNNLASAFNRIKLAESELRFDYYNRDFDRSFGFSFYSFPTYDGTIIPEGYDSSFGTGFMVNNSYDGKYLIGGYDTGFNLAFNAHFGESFYKDEFGEGFARPQ